MAHVIVLITGAAGFLGSNLVMHMAAAHPDAMFFAADLSWSRALSQLGTATARVECVELDVRDSDACNQLMHRTQPTHLLHAAAITYGPAELVFAVNRDGTANMLEATRRAASVTRGIYLSSSAVYSQQGEGCCDEDAAPDLSTPYARSKRDAELLLSSEFVAARVAPVYGPYEQQTAMRPRVSLVQRLLEAWRDDREIAIAGGEFHRDWTHAADVARAVDALLMAETLHSSIYNVSAGVSVATRRIVEIFASYGLRVRWTADQADAEIVLDVSASRKPLCCTRLYRDTGFAARFDIEAGIASLIHF